MTDRQVIITPTAPLRAAPRPDASLDTEGLFGETVDVEAVDGGFSAVVLGIDGYRGWVPSDCLGTAPAATHQLVAPLSYLTSAADVKSHGLGHLSMGARLHVRPLDAGVNHDDFAAVSFLDKTAFVPKRHILPLGAKVDDWVTVAESLMGSPYRWGGRAATGLDCSALVQLALATAGKAVPRDSVPQHAIGAALTGIDDLRRGDLVFWAGHVGIMQDHKNLLHANAYHMAVASEPLAAAVARIASVAGPVTALRRP